MPKDLPDDPALLKQMLDPAGRKSGNQIFSGQR